MSYVTFAKFQLYGPKAWLAVATIFRCSRERAIKVSFNSYCFVTDCA